ASGQRVPKQNLGTRVGSPSPPQGGGPGGGVPEQEGTSVFKWVCLLVAVGALSAYGWMLNDMRLEVKNLTTRLDQSLPRILTETERVTGQLDAHLPKLLQQAETAAANISTQLPPLLRNSEQVSATLNRDLPRLFANSETAVDGVAQLSDGFDQYRSLMGV